MSEPLGFRAYARHRASLGLPGRTHKAVSTAVRDGRLVQSVGRDAQGRTVILDAALADREWLAHTDPGRRRTLELLEAGDRERARDAAAPEMAGVADRLQAVLDEFADTLGAVAVAGVGARVLEGAAEVLAETKGRPATTRELEAVLLDGDMVERWGETVAGCLYALMDGVSEAERAEMDRNSGRKLVLDGDTGNGGDDE